MKSLFSTFIFILFLASYSAQLPLDGLVSFFPLSGDATDDMDYQDGILVGNVVPAADRFGNQGCALEFDGSQSSLILWQGFEDYNIHPDSSLSISLWYKGGSDEAGDYEVLFLKYGDGFNPQFNPAYGLVLYDLNKVVMSSVNHSLWINDGIIPFPGDTSWHHLVGVFEVGHWKIYLDNELVQEQEDMALQVEQIASDLVMGAGFEGIIDDVAFYKRALNPNEVSELYNLESACLVGINSILDQKDLVLYPNPTSGILNIDKFEGQIDRLHIHSLNGQKLRELLIDPTTQSFSIDDLSRGSYIVSYSKDFQEVGRSLILKY